MFSYLSSSYGVFLAFWCKNRAGIFAASSVKAHAPRSTRGCPRTRQLSSTRAVKALMRGSALRRTKSARIVVQLPIRTQMTFGGLPKRELLCAKSESLETMTNSFSNAYCQTSRSEAPGIPQSRRWSEPGYKSERAIASRGDRFSSNKSFTMGRSRIGVRCRRQRQGKHGYRFR